AARDLAVTWSETAPPFPGMEALYDHIRNAPVAGVGPGGGREVDPAPTLEAIVAAATALAAEYEVPFQSHARMGPSVGLADVRDGEALVSSDTQKPHNTRDRIATS